MELEMVSEIKLENRSSEEGIGCETKLEVLQETKMKRQNQGQRMVQGNCATERIKKKVRCSGRKWSKRMI